MKPISSFKRRCSYIAGIYDKLSASFCAVSRRPITTGYPYRAFPSIPLETNAYYCVEPSDCDRDLHIALNCVRKVFGASPYPFTAPVDGQRAEDTGSSNDIVGFRLCRFFRFQNYFLRYVPADLGCPHCRSVRHYRCYVGISSGKPTVNPIKLGRPCSTTLTLRRSDFASPAVDDRSPGFSAAARTTNAADRDCTASTAAITTTAAIGTATATGTDDGGRDGDGDGHRRERRATAGRTTADDAAAVTAMVAAAVAAAAAVTTIHSPRHPGCMGVGNG